MEKTSSSSWVHFLKVLFVGTALCLSVFSTPSQGVLKQSKQSKRSTIRQTIVNLKQSQRRWIQVDLSQQRLIAWEGKKPVYRVIISTGKKSTPTRTGVFRIQTKLRKTRMRGRGYNVPNVPYTMYYREGYAIHGAYWHRRFGTPVSHGCINLPPKHARWVYKWASVGTPVVVQR
ncbi:MAG: L,D-transpeptidase [Pelatocladus maniniholoensis HA4357-MV3]|jgi:lipoprotein-anchoring transpeptidase ErfK/SrfK|uniref:L,D-transpeptidase n=1 Tax=Pelatocladus maniniholoensis HA4357-MV3 TaxID=1117104 RepID=A0A9E3HAK7_9NOST|nr:L,D-transpeptidase [Pelatocladus maniniholoensis HA4357-MV3]